MFDLGNQLFFLRAVGQSLGLLDPARRLVLQRRDSGKRRAIAGEQELVQSGTQAIADEFQFLGGADFRDARHKQTGSLALQPVEIPSGHSAKEQQPHRENRRGDDHADHETETHGIPPCQRRTI